MPLPREETTPPVMKMNRAMEARFIARPPVSPARAAQPRFAPARSGVNPR